MNMPIKKIFVTFVVFVSFFVFTDNVSGQRFYLGPQLGISFQTPSLLDIEFSTDTTFLYGFRAGVTILFFAVELNYFQAAHNMELKELVTFEWGGREIDYNYLGLNGKLFLPVWILHPYLTVGYGYYSADIFDVAKDTDRGFNLGLGLELQLGKSFSLLAEGKYHHAKLNIDEEELKISNYTIAGGFNFYF
jgi:hypothetical protein